MLSCCWTLSEHLQLAFFVPQLIQFMLLHCGHHVNALDALLTGMLCVTCHALYCQLLMAGSVTWDLKACNQRFNFGCPHVFCCEVGMSFAIHCCRAVGRCWNICSWLFLSAAELISAVLAGRIGDWHALGHLSRALLRAV